MSSLSTIDHVVLRDGEPEGVIAGAAAAQAYLVQMCSETQEKERDLYFKVSDGGLNYKLFIAPASSWYGIGGAAAQPTLVHHYRACPLTRL